MTEELPDKAGGGPPDGYVVVHTPKDGDPYVIGPYPPIPELIALVVAKSICDCQREALPAAFPKGIVMAFDAEALLPGLATAVAATLNSVDEDEPIH